MKTFLRLLFWVMFVGGLLCLGCGIWFLITTMRAGQGLQDVAMIVDWVISFGATGIGIAVASLGATGLLAVRGETDVGREQGKVRADETAKPPPG